MSASTYLANYGITVQQAHDFILGHLNDPALIFNTASQYGVTNEMLGEIVSGYNADQVQAFFDSHGFAGGQLDSAHQLMADEMMPLSNLISLDTYGGALSVASLRSQVVAQTGLASYQHAFNADLYDGAADGFFSPTELGISTLGTLPASTDTLESLFYGTLINTLKAIDMDEISQLLNFVQTNQTALANGNDAVFGQFITLMVSVFEDPASPAIMSDAEIVEIAVTAGTLLVQAVGQAQDMALFDGLLSGFLP